MSHHPHDIARTVLYLLIIFILVEKSLQDALNVLHKAAHLPETKFNVNEYSEYPDTDDKDKGLQSPQWDQVLSSSRNEQFQISQDGVKLQPPTLNMTWDSTWASDLKFGQLSAVTIDPSGNIAVFHRGDRIWTHNTFDSQHRFDPNNGPIKQDTIILLNKAGKRVLSWGKNMFYLPHGLTIDTVGNYWITDVAMHQVFKFDAADINKHWEELKKENYNSDGATVNMYNPNNLFENSILKPSLILGEAFEPGNDDTHFCKPTAVAIRKNGDFFVSDGYCNSRIIKFNKNGKRILHWGRPATTGSAYVKAPPVNAFLVPHALSLADDLNYLFVADRENGRALCFFANNGSFYKEYKDSLIGTKIYSVAYAQEKLYLINGPTYETVPQFANVHTQYIRGFVFDSNTGNLLSQFGPEKGMDRPHDIAVTEDGSEIYVVDLDSKKIYRFLQAANISLKIQNTSGSVTHHEPAPLTDTDSKESSAEGPATATLVLSFVTVAVVFIALCIGIAAVVARCQKRGCLLTVRKRIRWEAERRENFKLSSLLENRRRKGFKFLEKRPNTRDFRKLNTEPETSEDEHPENSLTKVI